MSEPPMSWSQIPMPSLLTDIRIGDRGSRDPERSGDAGPIDPDPAARAERGRVVDYARELWSALDQVARYLVEQVARGGSGPVLAQPQPLLQTDEQWDQWRELYASVLSLLAGPLGDEGYGHQEARLEYQNSALYRPRL
jgi:hypothetical protein